MPDKEIQLWVLKVDISQLHLRITLVSWSHLMCIKKKGAAETTVTQVILEGSNVRAYLLLHVKSERYH